MISMGKNQDILESIAKNASDLALKIKDALFETGIDFRIYTVDTDD